MISHYTAMSGTETPQNSVETAINITGMNNGCRVFHILKDTNLTVAGVERIVVCDPSYSGKSTMTRSLA